MNRYQAEHDDDTSNYQTHRSARYRHPEQDNNYGSQGRSGYGDQGYERDGSRNVANHGNTYSTSRNYGSMGSYGGAQGFGSARGGQHPSQRNDSSGYNYYSGMGSPEEARQSNLSSPSRGNSYGGSNSFYSDNRQSGRGSDMGMSSNAGGRNLYGNDTSRRFEGSDQNRYHFNNEDNYGSHSYGGGQRGGNYQDSGYERDYRPDNYSGFWGSRDGYAHGGDNGSTSETYGMSGFFSDQDNRESDYIQSRNEGRTFDRNHDRRNSNNGYNDRY